MDVEAMEKMVNERYGSRSSLGYNDEDYEEDITELEQQTLLPSVRDPKLWLVKCLPGREREVAAFLMQKSLDKDSKSHILSAIALDHLKSYIYVESYCEAHVTQACKGMRYVFARNVTMVPLKEMRNVLSVDPLDSKEIHVSRGDWVRLKRSNLKGELAKVVDVDTVKHKVIVKVTPKLSALSLSDKLEGVDYLYKTVALSSVTTEDIQPSIQEVENFRDIGDADVDLGSLFRGKEKGCWMRGDAVVVMKGDLKNMKGFVEYVEGDIVHIRPNEKIPLPMKTVAVLGKDLAKYFEPGIQVKVICGQMEGATGMVVKVDQNKLVILSDESKELITVFSAQVVESNETSENRTKSGIGYSNQDKPQNSSASRPLPNPANSSGKLLPGNRPSSTLGRGTGYNWRRHDSFIGSNVKILHGPYKGYRGCVKGVNGQNVRVELQAQMKVVTGKFTKIILDY
ncbi:putative transcription elongation factor SPT5 homolog 1 [Spinacia oleracea]|uniref:Transcription elongation factor SPT5 homolog 1 n=1 Tax=Spinacia oleracea TaxID=3562 RepID=A0A9R0K3Z3_SPIOL|nr:putative transcription elongation factor SPT5 homolog 1 [Spinacia oleracea]